MKKLKIAMVAALFTASFLLSNTLFVKAEESKTNNVTTNVENNTEKGEKAKSLSKKKLVRNSSLYKSFKKTKNYSTKYKYLSTLNKEYNSYLNSPYKEESTIKDYKSKLSAMKKTIKANYDKVYKANYKASKTNYNALKSKSKNLSTLYKRVKSEGNLVFSSEEKSKYLKKIRSRYLSMNYKIGDIELKNMANKFIKKINYKGDARYYCPIDKNNKLIKKECTFIDQNRNVYYILSGKKLEP